MGFSGRAPPPLFLAAPLAGEADRLPQGAVHPRLPTGAACLEVRHHVLIEAK